MHWIVFLYANTLDWYSLLFRKYLWTMLGIIIGHHNK